MTDMARLCVLNATRRLVLLVLAIGLASGSAARASTLTVPYTETFATGDANWKIGQLATDVPTWQSSGGPGDSAYISQQFAVPLQPSGFSGPVIFRGQGIFDSSDDRFVGNWIGGGVAAFSVALRHGAPAPILFEMRFSPTANSPGASTVRYPVPSNAWTTITVPIVDSQSSFQAYSQFTPPDPQAFSAIFSDMANIQIGLSALGSQDSAILGNTYSFDLAAPSISAVPEPSAWATLAAAAAAASAAFRFRRLRGRHAA